MSHILKGNMWTWTETIKFTDKKKWLPVKHDNNNTKNSTTFSNYVRNVPIQGDEIMVSFDITSLYTNIPIIDTLNIIKDYVHSDDPFARKTAIPQDKFLDLVNLVLTTTWYTLILSFINKLMALQWET